jgi:hypothetical protein
MNARRDIIYVGNELNKIINYRNIFNIDFNSKITEFENRTEDLTNILTLIMNKKNTHILIIGRTQDGKTYIMLKTIHNIINTSLIPLSNIFIITGLSSTDWVEQMKNRTPEILHSNIYHRQDLKTKFVDKIKSLGKNIIINIDEAHIASSFKNTLAQVFKELKLDDKQYLYENNILIIEYTATPNGTIIDLDNTKKDNYDFYKLNKLPEYTGIEDLLNQDRVRQCKNLYLPELKQEIFSFIKNKKNKNSTDNDSSNVNQYEIELINCIELKIKELSNQYLSNKIKHSFEEIKLILEDYDIDIKYYNVIYSYYSEIINIYNSIIEIKEVVDNYNEPSYVLVRTKLAGKQDYTIDLFKQFFNTDNTNFLTYDRESYITKDILKIKPTKTTIIFIKEMLRCSITLYKRYISVLYDRHSYNSNDDTKLQGLAFGRSSGYDDNGKFIVFGDINSGKKYIELYNANFGDNSIIWNSNTTTIHNKITTSLGTYNNDECVKTGTRIKKNNQKYNILFEECKSPQEAQEFVDKIAKIKHIIDFKRGMDKNGYYLTRIKNKIKPRTIEEVKQDANYKLKPQINNTKRNTSRSSNEVIEPCYKDLNLLLCSNFLLAYTLRVLFVPFLMLKYISLNLLFASYFIS